MHALVLGVAVFGALVFIGAYFLCLALGFITAPFSWNALMAFAASGFFGLPFLVGVILHFGEKWWG